MTSYWIAESRVCMSSNADQIRGSTLLTSNGNYLENLTLWMQESCQGYSSHNLKTCRSTTESLCISQGRNIETTISTYWRQRKLYLNMKIWVSVSRSILRRHNGHISSIGARSGISPYQLHRPLGESVIRRYQQITVPGYRRPSEGNLPWEDGYR